MGVGSDVGVKTTLVGEGGARVSAGARVTRAAGVAVRPDGVKGVVLTPGSTTDGEQAPSSKTVNKPTKGFMVVLSPLIVTSLGILSNPGKRGIIAFYGIAIPASASR